MLTNGPKARQPGCTEKLLEQATGRIGLVRLTGPIHVTRCVGLVRLTGPIHVTRRIRLVRPTRLIGGVVGLVELTRLTDLSYEDLIYREGISIVDRSFVLNLIY